MIFVIATNVIKPESLDEYIKIAKANIPTVHKEDGCISYTLTKDFKTGMEKQTFCGANVLTFLECWESLEHLKKHLQSPHMKIFAEKTAPLKLESTLKVVESV